MAPREPMNERQLACEVGGTFRLESEVARIVFEFDCASRARAFAVLCVILPA